MAGHADSALQDQVNQISLLGSLAGIQTLLGADALELLDGHGLKLLSGVRHGWSLFCAVSKSWKLL